MPTSRGDLPTAPDFANIPYGWPSDIHTPLALLAPIIQSVSLAKIRVAKVTNRRDKYPMASFGLAADMKEVGRSGDILKLRFIIAVETSPLVQRAELEGSVDVRVDHKVLAAMGGTLGEDFASELALQLYKQNYDTIYALFDTLSLDSPSPWLLRDVHLVS